MPRVLSILFCFMVLAAPAHAKPPIINIIEVGAGVNVGGVWAEDRRNWLAGENYSLRWLWGRKHHFLGLGWEFGALRWKLEDEIHRDVRVSFLTFYTMPLSYRYQRNDFFLDLTWFLWYGPHSETWAGIHGRLGYVKRLGHFRVGVGLGPGYGGEDMFYLNLQTFVGFDF